MRRSGALIAFTSLLLGCGANSQPAQVVQVEMPAVAAPPETQFRGHFTIDWADFGTQVAQDDFARAADGRMVELLRCLRSEKAAPIEVWVTGMVDQGKLSGAKANADASPGAAKCAVSVLSKVGVATSAPVAVSIFFQAEPAPADCKGKECTEFTGEEARAQEQDRQDFEARQAIMAAAGRQSETTPLPAQQQPAQQQPAQQGTTAKSPQSAATIAKRKALLENAAEFGMIGRFESGVGGANVGDLGALTDAPVNGIPGDTFGAGGLGLSGLGEGAGGRGEGIGLGSLGGFGHGSGLSGGGIGGAGGFGTGRLGSTGIHRKSATVRMGTVTSGPKLPKEVIQRIVRQNFGKFRLCYEKALQTNPTLAGSVTVDFVIEADGSVKTAGDGGNNIGDATMLRCVFRSFVSLSFPAPEGGVVKVLYPIHFAPPDDSPPPPPPIVKVDGVGFPALDATKVAAKLTSKGREVMTVDGATAQAPFAVFAIKKGTPIHPMQDASSSLTIVSRVDAHTFTPGFSQSESEGFKLIADGTAADEVLSDLVGPKP